MSIKSMGVLRQVCESATTFGLEDHGRRIVVGKGSMEYVSAKTDDECAAYMIKHNRIP